MLRGYTAGAMEADALQHAINELVKLEFRLPDTAAWVRAVEASPTNVPGGCETRFGADQGEFAAVQLRATAIAIIRRNSS
jgi:hypothetical protein